MPEPATSAFKTVLLFILGLSACLQLGCQAFVGSQRIAVDVTIVDELNQPVDQAEILYWPDHRVSTYRTLSTDEMGHSQIIFVRPVGSSTIGFDFGSSRQAVEESFGAAEIQLDPSASDYRVRAMLGYSSRFNSSGELISSLRVPTY